MQVDTFIHQFGTELTALEKVPLIYARHRYDQLCRSFSPPDPDGMRINNDVVNGVAIRRFLPQHTTKHCLLFLHGGGFTMGSVESHHGPAASLADQLNHAVISVDYRLAPEVAYSTMLADCLAVFDAVNPIALVGDSAGGRLAIDIAHTLISSPPLGLIYPPMGGLSPSFLGDDAPLLTRNDIQDIRQQHPDIMATQRDQLPPADIIEVLSVARDPLTQPIENIINQWQETGAVVGYRCAPHMVHAALHAHAQLAEMQTSWQAFCQALKQHLTD